MRRTTNKAYTSFSLNIYILREKICLQHRNINNTVKQSATNYNIMRNLHGLVINIFIQ